jgi:ATP-dependent protease ClpP protease subunit
MKKKYNSEKNSMEQVIFDPLVKEMEANMVLKHRIVPFYDEVDRDSIFKALYWIDKLVMLDEKEGIKRPIEIVIDSYGGYCYHGLSLISRIKELIDKDYEIITTCRGVAMSMGSAILMAGSKRRAYRYGTILIHQVSSGHMGEVQTLREGLKESERLWDLLQSLIIKDTKITKEQLDDITVRKFDWILTPEQALELNVIDEIL